MPLPHRTYGPARTIAPKGRLDHDNCEAFRADLAPHLEACVRDGQPLVLELSGLEYVSSAGLRCLMIAGKEARARRGRVVVAAVQRVVAGVFRVGRFNVVVDVFPTLREGPASVSPQAA